MPASVGALEVLAVSVNVLGQAAALAGDFARAGLLVVEADAVTEAIGANVAPYGALVLRALHGREAEAAKLIEATIAEATAGGQGTAVQYAHWANAILLNALGRYDEALVAAVTASDDTPELFVATWALSELVEAAVRSGNADRAAAAVERLAESAAPSATEWGLGMAARARALIADGEAAEAGYREAIERLGVTQLRPELARAHLLYGEWLRREGRRVDAREQLRTAHGLLVGLGMEAFAERARRELLATGERVRKRSRGDARRAHRCRRSRSPGSRATACPTRRSPPGCSSAPARSSGTWARCSPSSGSARAWACTTRCPAWTRRPRPRRCRTSSSRSPTRRTRPRPS